MERRSLAQRLEADNRQELDSLADKVSSLTNIANMLGDTLHGQNEAMGDLQDTMGGAQSALKDTMTKLNSMIKKGPMPMMWIVCGAFVFFFLVWLLLR